MGQHQLKLQALINGLNSFILKFIQIWEKYSMQYLDISQSLKNNMKELESSFGKF